MATSTILPPAGPRTASNSKQDHGASESPLQRGAATPRVLIVQHARYWDTPGVLRGIMQHQKVTRPWNTFIDDVTRTDKNLRWLTEQRWDGVINGVDSSAITDTCLRLGVPIVELWDSPARPGTPKVRPDNVSIGHMAAEHLLDKRFREFGFTGFSGVSWSTERLAGFSEALNLVKMSCEVHMVERPADPDPSWDANQVELLAEWLLRLPRGTAVLACDDERARQVARAATQAGLSVPQDVAVLGVNNDGARCEQEEPAISSVATDNFAAGIRVAEQLDLLMTGRELKTVDFRIEPLGVVTRRSTDALALRDKHVAAAVDFIREQACRGITVDEVVAQVHASRSQLESRFRRFLGHSPQVEIRRVQLEKIRSLLAETELSLKEIADRTGFVHVEYMCVLFKRMTGETPGRYRRNVQAQERVRACS